MIVVGDPIKTPEDRIVTRLESLAEKEKVSVRPASEA